MNKLFLIGIFLVAFSLPSYAQFLGLRIGIPGNKQNAALFGGGGIPAGTLQDDAGHYLQDDAGHYLTGS